MVKHLWGKLTLIILCAVLVLGIGIKRGIFAAAFNQIQRVGFSDLVINEVMSANRNFIQDNDGDYSGYIEIYNNSDQTANLKGFGLSNQSKKPLKWVFPDTVLDAHSYLVVWTSGKSKADAGGLHCNFELDKNDEAVILTSPDHRWNSIFLLEKMHENISCGLRHGEGNKVFWFDGGTPGTENTLEPLACGASQKRAADVRFSPAGGFYEDEIELTLVHEDPDVKIRYTVDGSDPVENSILYEGAIIIPRKVNEATVIRARAFKEGYPKSDVVTNTYFVERGITGKYNIPVVSIVTDPDNLFGYERGILTAGKVRHDWIKENPNAPIERNTPANYSQEGRQWERQGHLEIMLPDGSPDLSQGIGIRTHGGYSLENANKSLRLIARDNFDNNDLFEYDFFYDGEDDLPSKSVILRNSSTDASDSLLRDAFIQSLADPELLDLQKSQPCIGFINGVYYGIYCFRTKYDAKYLENKYGITPESAVICKNPTGDIGDEIELGYTGDEIKFNQLYRFIQENDMSLEESLVEPERLMDIDNYIEYNILEIFCGNEDWPANNVRIFRKRTEKYEPDAPYGCDGRWRWLVFDLDYGFGLFYKSYKNDTLAMATATGSREWNNPDEYTMMLRRLLDNETFRNKFVNRFADLLNTAYSAPTVIRRLEEMQAIYAPYVHDHIKRWKLHKGRIGEWLDEIEYLREYAANRPDYIRQFICSYFEIETANLSVTAGEGGSVTVNSITLGSDEPSWQGIYFRGVPVTLKAAAEEGYRFARWEGGLVSDNPELAVNLPAETCVHAVFEKTG